MTILFSLELYEEMQSVLKRPKFKKYFSEADIQELSELLYDKVEWIEITTQFDDCRDAKDNFLLDLSISADILIYGR